MDCPYRDVSLSVLFSVVVDGMMSPFTVLPLHLVDVAVPAVSQFDQSVSSTESIVRGVQENRLDDLVASVLDRISAGAGREGDFSAGSAAESCASF